MIVPATYEMTLGSSGKLKAKALLASGTAEDVFEACVLLHDAARIERRAAAALIEAPPETRFAALVEECACLVDGLDPGGAVQVWSQIQALAEASLEPELARVMLSRLTPRYERLRDAYARALAGTTTLRHMFAAHRIMPVSEVERRRASRDVQRLSAEFPGFPVLWWTAYRLAEAGQDLQTAWSALTRARRLDPENKRFQAISLLAAAQALDPRAADEHLAGVRGQLATAGPEVCLMYALAELRLARSPSERRPERRWERALAAARAGREQPATGKLYDNLRAVALLAEAYVQGTPPSVELFYRAGLGDLAARAQPADDVLELLTNEGLERLSIQDAA